MAFREMRSVFIIIALLLTASLLAWHFLFKKPAIQPIPGQTAKLIVAPNTPTNDLFKTIAPLIPRSKPIDSSVSSISSHLAVTTVKQQPPATDLRIKQRDNKQQSNSRFEKISFNGDLLNKNVIRWSCARDLESGLLWETKLSNGGVSDASYSYSWFNPEQNTPQQGRRNGGNCYGSGCDTHAYIEEMNRMVLCGSRHWRLPTFSELESLIDRKYYNPTINQNIFPHSKSTVYWSSTELENNPEMVMQVDFFNGVSNAVPKSLSYPIRVVSDSP